jgi:hypothetical protein
MRKFVICTPVTLKGSILSAPYTVTKGTQNEALFRKIAVLGIEKDPS